MREIDAKQITDVVARLCVDANRHLAPDVRECIEGCRACEPWPIAQNILDRIQTSYDYVCGTNGGNGSFLQQLVDSSLRLCCQHILWFVNYQHLLVCRNRLVEQQQVPLVSRQVVPSLHSGTMISLRKRQVLWHVSHLFAEVEP